MQSEIRESQDQANEGTSSIPMPSFYISHRGPGILDDTYDYVKLLKTFPSLLPAKPKGIVIFSAHFESSTQIISYAKNFETIYDFTGYPEKYYKLKYPAEGDPELAEEIQSLLKENGVECNMDTTRGLDHGAWTVLMLMFPNADIPVVSMSVNPDASHEEIYRIGKALGPLQEKGVLILGSGSILHNVDLFNMTGEKPAADWAIEFSDWMNERVLSWNTKELFDYRTLSRYGKQAAPTEEHFIPYLYPMGAGDKAKKPAMLHYEIVFETMLYVLYRFDP